MGDICSAVRLDFYTILVPGSSYALVWHFALKNCLILCLHREVRDTLVDLQFFLWTVRKTEAQKAESTTCRGLQTSGEVWWLERAELDAVRWRCVRIIWLKKKGAGIVCEDNMVIICWSVGCSLSLCVFCFCVLATGTRGITNWIYGGTSSGKIWRPDAGALCCYHRTQEIMYFGIVYPKVRCYVIW